MAAVTSPTIEFNPGKDVVLFREYDSNRSTWDAGVYEHYRGMRANQTMAFADRMEGSVFKFDHAEMTVREAFEALKPFVDRSDPDIVLPNMIHMLQTAERARAAGKPGWMQLTCLIHDMGKAMFLWGKPEDGMGGRADEPQYALGGDTWVLGCRIPDCTVYSDLNALNPDMKHAVYSTENGIYQPGCGMMSLRFVVGHDEYMYRMLLANDVPLANIPEAMAMIRLHSCYPWHKGGAYRHLMAPGDEALEAAVREFNQFDLYSKSDGTPDIDVLWPHYQTLIDEYMPGKLRW